MSTTAKRPGRPEVGPMINVRMPRELIDWIDERRAGIVDQPSRAEFVRAALEGMRGRHSYLEATTERMIEEDRERERNRLTHRQRWLLDEVRAHGGELAFDGLHWRTSAQGLVEKGWVTMEVNRGVDPRFHGPSMTLRLTTES